MTNTIDGGRAEEFIGEGVTPLGKIQVAGDDSPIPFVAFSDQVMEVLVLGRTKRFQSEVVNNQKIDLGECSRLS